MKKKTGNVGIPDEVRRAKEISKIIGNVPMSRALESHGDQEEAPGTEKGTSSDLSEKKETTPVGARVEKRVEGQKEKPSPVKKENELEVQIVENVGK